MEDVQSLTHAKWECKYHVVWIPKCRKKTLYGELRKYLGETFRDLAVQKDCNVIEGHLLPQYKRQIFFRFTIGSADSEVLKFWEPNAPDFMERLESLKYAFDQGYKTSISCEPMLDENIDRVVELVSHYVTDSIWLGKINHLNERLSLNGFKDQETLRRAKKLMDTQTDDQIWGIYDRYEDDPQIKWKESIKKVVGLEIPVEKGLDV